MISQWLRPAVANGENIEARDAMSYAQYLAGMAFNNASLGYVHAMAHQLGGFYNLPHGVCNAVLLPHVCEFNLIACQDRYAKIAELMGVNTDGFTETEAAFAAIDAIRELSSSIGIPSGLNELGVKTEDLAIMAENAQKDACMLTNPRKATHAQVVEIFKAAL
jgi:alcohol dehydrogenase